MLGRLLLLWRCGGAIGPLPRGYKRATILVTFARRSVGSLSTLLVLLLAVVLLLLLLLLVELTRSRGRYGPELKGPQPVR